MPENIKNCSNYKICYGILPLFRERGTLNYNLCGDCNRLFRKSPTFNRTPGSCDVCKVQDNCFKQVGCRHILCKICFQKCKFGLPDITKEPPFPYPDIEDQYFNETHILWNLHGKYPLIEKWKKKCEKYDTICQSRMSLKKSDKCPICGL